MMRNPPLMHILHIPLENPHLNRNPNVHIDFCFIPIVNLLIKTLRVEPER